MEPNRSAAPPRRSARERLLAAADELFYEGGIHTVGIDRVIERAGVAKASLYDCFGSKEELVRAYLQARHEARKERISARLQRHADPRERLLCIFDSMAEVTSQPNFRGCPFARAMAETPAGGVASACEDARGWLRELFTGLAGPAGASDPAGLARQLMLLYDGAALSAQVDGPGAARVARAAAAVMLDHAAAAAPGRAAPRGRAAATRRRKTASA